MDDRFVGAMGQGVFMSTQIAGEGTGTRLAPQGSPWPPGHGLQLQATAVCSCGRAVLSCEAMGEWAARRRAQRRQPIELPP
jgi:hypothetical protein